MVISQHYVWGKLEQINLALNCSPEAVLFSADSVHGTLAYPQLCFTLFVAGLQVTGGSSGIGKAIAAEVVKRGASVTLLARSQVKQHHRYYLNFPSPQILLMGLKYILNLSHLCFQVKLSETKQYVEKKFIDDPSKQVILISLNCSLMAVWV